MRLLVTATALVDGTTTIYTLRIPTVCALCLFPVKTVSFSPAWLMRSIQTTYAGKRLNDVNMTYWCGRAPFFPVNLPNLSQRGNIFAQEAVDQYVVILVSLCFLLKHFLKFLPIRYSGKCQCEIGLCLV